MDKVRFTRRVRLLNKADYSWVFAQASKSSDTFFTVLYRANNLSYARLGLAVSRKSARAAVARNRVKRVVRTSFRLSQHRLAAVDIVVIARAQLAQQNNTALFASMAQHWRKIAGNSHARSC